MPHRQNTASFATVLAILLLALLAPGPAAAQLPSPINATWQNLPNVVREGARVVVKTRDGHSTRGRLRGLSDTAIVVESGRVRTIPAAEVVSIEDWRGKRPIMRGMKGGCYAGLFMAGLYFFAAAPYLDGQPCAPADEDCITGSDVLEAAIVLPAMGAAIGAGLGALIPGDRRLVYKARTDVALGIAPITGRGRRGAAVRVAF